MRHMRKSITPFVDGTLHLTGKGSDRFNEKIPSSPRKFVFTSRSHTLRRTLSRNLLCLLTYTSCDTGSFFKVGTRPLYARAKNKIDCAGLGATTDPSLRCNERAPPRAAGPQGWAPLTIFLNCDSVLSTLETSLHTLCKKLCDLHYGQTLYRTKMTWTEREKVLPTSDMYAPGDIFAIHFCKI